MIKAYRRLDDEEGLSQYCKNFIESSSSIEISLDFDVPSYDEANVQERIYMYILPEILRACAKKIRPDQVPDQRDIALRNLGDAYMELGRILQINEEYNQAIEHYFKSLTQYKQCSNRSESISKLISFIEEVQRSETVDVTTLVSKYVSILPTDGTYVWLKVASVYRQCEFQSDVYSPQINNSVEACSRAFAKSDDTTPLFKAACHYTMLRIYKDLRYADDTGRTFIEQMARDDNYQRNQSHLSLLDRRLLCQWARNFINEYNQRHDDDEQDTIPDTLANQFHVPSLVDAMKEIDGKCQFLGDILILLDDHSGATAYWQWVVDEYESLYSKLEEQIIYDNDTTISDVLFEMHQLDRNAHEYILRLSRCHEQLARYQIQASESLASSRDDAISYLESALKASETAIQICKHLNDSKKTELNDLIQLSNEIQSRLATIKAKPQYWRNDQNSNPDGIYDENELDVTD